MKKTYQFNLSIASKFYLVGWFYFLSNIAVAQIVFENIQSPIYSFIEELANDKYIELNSCIKPYSRQYISQKLLEAENHIAKMTSRQKSELIYYKSIYSLEENLNDTTNIPNTSKDKPLKYLFNPIGIKYLSKNFKFYAQPIIGRSYIFRDDKEYCYVNKIGASTYAYLGKNIGIYASLTDNYQYKYIFPKPNQLINLQGASYKINQGGRIGADFSDMVGGITYSWRWGSLGIVKDNLVWGDNINGSNIFSGRTPSFGMIQLKMSPASWIDFNYFHGWLTSMVIDSSRSYISQNGIQRNIYREKYIASNMLTIRPINNLNFSFGNSIIYSDKSIQIAYLIPFMFYKSVDHSITMGTENENSQLFFNLSSRNIKHVHLYASYFIDEFSFTRIFSTKRHNFTSAKIGFSISNLLFKNTSLSAEYTKTNPLTYKHRLETTTFGTNNYDFGHYLGDNAMDVFVSISYKPIPVVKFTISGNYAQKGNDYEYKIISGQRLDEYPIMKNITWGKKEFCAKIDIIFLKNIYFNIGYIHSQTTGFDIDGKSKTEYLNKFSPTFFQGIKNFYFFGVNLGFN